MVVINRPVKVDPTKLQYLIEMACDYNDWTEIFGIIDITNERFCMLVKDLNTGICHSVDLDCVKKALATMPEKHFDAFMNDDEDSATLDAFLRACVKK